MRFLLSRGARRGLNRRHMVFRQRNRRDRNFTLQAFQQPQADQWKFLQADIVFARETHIRVHDYRRPGAVGGNTLERKPPRAVTFFESS